MATSTPRKPSFGSLGDHHNESGKNRYDVAELAIPDQAYRDDREGHTLVDKGDMGRMGKKQEFKRNFGFMAAFGFTSIYIATWEYLLVSVYSGLVNGGFGGLVYEYIGTSICYLSVVMSLAEMSSMAPTSGGNYHWVSEFAPPSTQKYLSYAAGWTSALGWLTGAASGAYIMSTLTASIIQIYLPDFAFSNWQGSLVMMAFVTITVLFNTLGTKLIPTIENISLFGHIGGFLITVIALWVMVDKRNSTHDVFVEVVNSGGWSNNGLSYLIGTVSVLYAQLGPDAAVHIAEEIREASVVLPNCILWGYVYNALLGFVMLITMLYTVGPLDKAIDADSPFQNAFAATGSKAMTTVLTVILALLIVSGNITAVTTTSRETWAFARDNGLPFHNWIAKVSRRFNAPLNAVYVTTILTLILCLINIGSTTAFNIVISLNLVAFLATYMLSIGCVLFKRIKGEPLPRSKWSLGKWGIPINAFACGYSALALVLSCFPIEQPVTLESANWAPLIFVGVLIIALVSYVVQGRKIYSGPVVFVEGWRREEDAFQTT